MPCISMFPGIDHDNLMECPEKLKVVEDFAKNEHVLEVGIIIHYSWDSNWI